MVGGPAADPVWLAVWAFLRWLRALYILRGIYVLGMRMLPIFFAIRDTLIFLLVVVFCLAASVHAYFLLGVSSEPSPFYSSLLTVFRLGVLGDFDMAELEGRDAEEDLQPSATNVPVHILFYTVACVLTIAMMNLYIGVLSSNYDRFEDQRLPIFLRSRAMMMTRFNSHPWVRSRVNWKGCRGYLWVATRAELNLEEERSVRTILKEEIRQALDEGGRQRQTIAK